MTDINRLFADACGTNDLEAVKALYPLITDIDYGGGYALWRAITSKSVSIVKFLLEKGADPAADDNVCIRTAVGVDDIEIIKMLLDTKKVDPSARTMLGNDSAIEIARKKDGKEILKLLLDYVDRKKTMTPTLPQTNKKKITFPKSVDKIVIPLSHPDLPFHYIESIKLLPDNSAKSFDMDNMIFYKHQVHRLKDGIINMQDYLPCLRAPRDGIPMKTRNSSEGLSVCAVYRKVQGISHRIYLTLSSSGAYCTFDASQYAKYAKENKETRLRILFDAKKDFDWAPYIKTTFPNNPTPTVVECNEDDEYILLEFEGGTDISGLLIVGKELINHNIVVMYCAN